MKAKIPRRVVCKLVSTGPYCVCAPGRTYSPFKLHTPLLSLKNSYLDSAGQAFQGDRCTQSRQFYLYTWHHHCKETNCIRWCWFYTLAQWSLVRMSRAPNLDRQYTNHRYDKDLMHNHPHLKQKRTNKNWNNKLPSRCLTYTCEANTQEYKLSHASIRAFRDSLILSELWQGNERLLWRIKSDHFKYSPWRCLYFQQRKEYP